MELTQSHQQDDGENQEQLHFANRWKGTIFLEFEAV